ncbi:Embryonic stem cell-specific 5-hydroxymethylcytosine-binding protein [Chionoecetes opilio]|uniref:Abasic site processing protein HMCES n=1 Tax=Chionoecetes opilio TaxID=41210 RepID=A0A8J5CX20_CHIOP|nr:Embryonic stem cell-specific 5-hydroxymethylcytosine-binding protein [Chionoecetes opilio]
MCGRTACTLAPDEVCKACSVRSVGADGQKYYQSLSWRDPPNNHTYTPSTNTAPSRYTPVIISEHQRGVKRTQDGEEQPAQRVVQPMMWGLVPPFHKGPSAAGHGYSTTNSRLEDVESKATYKPSLAKGQRCVVLCDGFYEWQTTKGTKNKQPYFIYAPQPKEVKIWDRDTWDQSGVWSEEEGWKGPQLLKMAGLFSCWKSTEGEEVMSYSVLTTETTSKKFSALHHRVPVILETDEEVETWLDSTKVNYKEALEMLRQKEEAELEWHPVSTDVNNSRNQQPDLQQPVSLDKKPPATAGSRFMSAWLGKASTQASKPRVKEQTGLVKEETGLVKEETGLVKEETGLVKEKDKVKKEEINTD